MSDIPQLRSRTPEAPYCWQAKGALRRILEHLDGDSILPFALTAYMSLTLNASDKEAEEFTTLQSYLSRLAGGISTRTLQRVLPVLREIGVLDYTTPRLRGPITFRLLSVATNSPNVTTNSHNVATGKKTAFQADNKNNSKKNNKKNSKKAPPTPSCDAIASEGVHADDSHFPQSGTGSNSSLNGDQEAGKIGDSSPATKRRKGDSAFVSAVVGAWNGADGLPQVRCLSEGRQRKLEARLGDPFFCEHYLEAIRRIAASSFCRGAGKNGWKATFDFLLKPDTVARAMEGAYDDRLPPTAESFL